MGRSWSYTNEGMDGPNTTIVEGSEPRYSAVVLTFHCDDGPGAEDWIAHLGGDEARWIRDRLIDVLGLPANVEGYRPQARAWEMAQMLGMVSPKGARTVIERIASEEACRDAEGQATDGA